MLELNKTAVTLVRRENQHRCQTFAHARVVRAELSARTKISGRLHKALEKKSKQNYEGVNTRKLSFNTRKILRNSLPYIFRCFLIFCVFVQSALLCIQFAFISHMCITFDRGVVKIRIDMRISYPLLWLSMRNVSHIHLPQAKEQVFFYKLTYSKVKTGVVGLKFDTVFLVCVFSYDCFLKISEKTHTEPDNISEEMFLNSQTSCCEVCFQF